MSSPAMHLIDFHEDTIEAIEQEGELWVSVPKLCMNLGLDPATQRTKILKEPAKFRSRVIPLPSASGTQDTICISARKVEAWVFSINANRVRKDLREKLTVYQDELGDAMHNYINKGVAVRDDRLGRLEFLDVVEYKLGPRLTECVTSISETRTEVAEARKEISYTNGNVIQLATRQERFEQHVEERFEEIHPRPYTPKFVRRLAVRVNFKDFNGLCPFTGVRTNDIYGNEIKNVAELDHADGNRSNNSFDNFVLMEKHLNRTITKAMRNEPKNKTIFDYYKQCMQKRRPEIESKHRSHKLSLHKDRGPQRSFGFI